MSNERTIEIDGIKYTIMLLPAKTGIALGVELFNLLHPVLAALADHNENEDLREISGSESMLYSIMSAHIAQNFTSTRVSNLVDLMLSQLYKGSHEVDYNEEFIGKYSQLAKLVEFAIKENGFLDFFTNFFKENGLGTLIPLKKENKATSTKPSRSKSTQKPQ